MNVLGSFNNITNISIMINSLLSIFIKILLFKDLDSIHYSLLNDNDDILNHLYNQIRYVLSFLYLHFSYIISPSS